MGIVLGYVVHPSATSCWMASEPVAHNMGRAPENQPQVRK